ncbi:uncharacterized protein LOC134258871 [Saccostrea cucullata]|uniref:uncharacterized protein LOC134249217 n=1 Tax=Saccostrea cuccullata TaxID=36930 RepID=UPI002ED49E1C
MAVNTNEQFLISMKIDGKDVQILGDCHLVESLNSDDQRKRDMALQLIRATCNMDDCVESSDAKSCSAVPCSADVESESLDQKMWNKQDTKTLFDIRSRMEKDFNSNKVHKSLWETIAKELSAVGVTASATQCMNKWKALKREYKKTVDNNAQTGSEKKTCHFF